MATETATEKLRKKREEEISDKTHSIKAKILDRINEYIIRIACIAIVILIAIAVYGFWLWLNVTKNPTECVNTISQARWNDYKYVIEQAKSSTIVALVAIMWQHKKTNNKFILAILHYAFYLRILM